MKTYIYPKVVKLNSTQDLTLKKMKYYGINVCKFIREAIKEKIEREYKDLIPKDEKDKCPF